MRQLAVGFCLLVFCLATDVAAQEQTDIILSARIDNHVLSEGMLAFQVDGQYLLPMAELAATLDFYVESDPETSRIYGWALSFDRAFELNGVAGTISGPNGTVDISPIADLIDLTVAGEAYVPLEQLNAIWPVTLTVDIRRLRIVVEADEPLPLQRRIERERRHRAVNAARAGQSDVSLPDATVPYGMLGGVVGHVEATASVADTATASASANISHDLLGASANWAYGRSIDENGDDQGEFLRFFLERQAAIGEMPFGIERIAAGDISSQTNPYVFDSAIGRGLIISSFGEVDDVFDQVDVRGDAPPDWEAELYINNALIDFQDISPEGRYAFENVPIQYGSNFIEVRLYGPHGEVITETRTIDIPPRSSRVGELAWAIRAGENRNLVELEDRGEASQWVQAELAYGIDELLTFRASLDGIREEDETYAVATLGLGASLWGVRLKPELLLSSDGSVGGAISLARSFRSGHLILDGAYVEGIETPRLGTGDDALRYTGTLEYSTAMVSAGLRNTLTFTAHARETVGGEQRADLSARHVVTYNSVDVSNIVRVRLNEDESQIGGRLILSNRRNQFTPRLSIDYDYEEDAFLTRAELSGNYRSSDNRWTGSASISRNFVEEEFEVRAAISRRFDQVHIGAEVAFDDGGDTEFNLRASSTFGYDNQGGLSVVGGDDSARGFANVRVFMDVNGNEVFDAEDEPLPDVGIRINRGLFYVRTDERGQVLLSGLSTTSPSRISVALRTLEDPFLVPATPGVQLIARTGTRAFIDLPVQYTGTIDGTVVDRESGMPRSSILVQLVNESGEPVAQTTSAYDGYFALEAVRLGSYSLQSVGPDGVQPAGRTVTLTYEDPFIYGIVIEQDRSN